jgi:putative flippase GtrA
MRSSSRVSLSVPAEAPAFLLVGGLGFLVDLGLTLALEPMLGAFAARPPAIALAVLATFALNRRLTFRADGHGVRAQLPRYLAACAASQAFNYAVYCFVLALAALLGRQGPPVVALAAVAGSAAAASLTFVLAKKWVFAAP